MYQEIAYQKKCILLFWFIGERSLPLPERERDVSLPPREGEQKRRNMEETKERKQKITRKVLQ